MSGGYGYGEQQPTEKCPYCQTPCDADFVDIGVGYQQCGPFYCQRCEASEIGPCDQPRALSETEKATGWYAPGKEPGSSANVIGGKVVSHRVMETAYRDKFTGNALYELPGEVEKWFAETRSATAGVTS
jgi:hypothetical protein